MELGQDTSIAGLLAFPSDMSKRMKNIRMFHGTILSDHAAWCFPGYSRKLHLNRMRRFTRNALIMADIFSKSRRMSGWFEPVFPAWPTHPDHEISKSYDYSAGTLNLRLLHEVHDPQTNLHDILDEMILAVLEQAKSDGTSLAWGESTGTCIPRLQVYFEYRWRIPPFLRISVGDKTIKETDRVARSIRDGLIRYLDSNSSKFVGEGECSARASLPVLKETGYFL
jgi:hypothetical protein